MPLKGETIPSNKSKFQVTIYSEDRKTIQDTILFDSAIQVANAYPETFRDRLSVYNRLRLPQTSKRVRVTKLP